MNTKLMSPAWQKAVAMVWRGEPMKAIAADTGVCPKQLAAKVGRMGLKRQLLTEAEWRSVIAQRKESGVIQ